jgi:beta-glucanase (GH16 family)
LRTSLAVVVLVLSGQRLVAAPVEATPVVAASPSVDLPGYQLTWSDEFDGDGLDGSRWSVRTGARRDAINSADAISVYGGTLTITTFTGGGTHFTGFIDTAGKYEPIFGFLEARIRFGPSPGEWSAFWLQSPTHGNPIGDPASAGAEIDIAEHRAVNTTGVDISAQFSSAVHWDGYADDHKSVTSGLTPSPPGPSLSGAWHVYGLLWTMGGYSVFLDGNLLWTTSSGVSRRSEFIRLTSEVQDAAWAGTIPTGGYGSLGESATKMDVDWVRVWQQPPVVTVGDASASEGIDGTTTLVLTVTLAASGGEVSAAGAGPNEAP